MREPRQGLTIAKARTGLAAKIKDVLRLNARVFLWAVGLNFLWEMAQAYAYTGMPPSTFSATLMCGKASLVDGLFVLGIFWAGTVVFSRVDWIDRPGLPGYFLMTAAGVLISAMVELNAVYHLGKWGYQRIMPQIPFLGVGALPVLQMVLLPPVIFYLSCRRLAFREK